MAPPCGTATRARNKRIAQHLVEAGAPDPRPLRSDEFPQGLPGLRPIDQAKVDSANSIYELCYRIMVDALEMDILVSCENPIRSYLWSIEPWSQLLNDSRCEPIELQNCMFGGARDKWSR